MPPRPQRMARRLHRWLRRSLLWLIDARPLSYGVMALGALLLVLALLGLGSCVHGCVAGGAGGSGRATSDAGSAGEVADVRSWQLPASFDAQLSSRLQELGREDVRVAKALDNLDAYAKVGNGGAYEQQKLLKLAADDPAAIDFVADLPESYPRARSEEYASGVTKGVVPRLYQWDKRWGYTEYCGRDFGTTGCCPTSFSMVYMAVTGNRQRGTGGLHHGGPLHRAHGLERGRERVHLRPVLVGEVGTDLGPGAPGRPDDAPA